MLARVVDLTRALREAGVPVAVSEDIDALEAVKAVGLSDRPAVRAALAATLVKSEAHMPAFDALFDIYFGARGETETSPDDGAAEGPEHEILGALVAGDGAAAGAFARRAVDRYGRVDDSPTGTRWYTYPVLRALALDSLLRRAEEMLDSDPTLSTVQRRTRAARAQALAEQLRAEIDREVRRRVAGQRGPEHVARYSVPTLPEDVELLSASAEEIERVRRAVRPLARKLAARMAMKRRRAARGSLDVRHTFRRSLSSGGAPFDPAFRKRPPHKPELWLLCDVSGSMGRFARFSLMLVHALASEFSKVRSFVFVDTVDEVTRLFETTDFVVAVDRMMREARPARYDEHSHYGGALESFWEAHSRDLTSHSTVLILGDARNNNRSTAAGVVRAMRAKARAVWWLNPEPSGMWDTGDSVVAEYETHLDGMVEVRNLRQLEDFISTLA